MDRNEAMMRELHLYPLWKRRNQPVPVIEEPVETVSVPAGQTLPSAMPGHDPVTSVQAKSVQHKTEISDPPAPSAETAISEVEKVNWPELKQQVRDCSVCKLRAGCTQTVFGVGDEKADWLFVGEGPGADEDALGEPFVGQAGKLLDNMLMAIKLKRGNNVYIANVVKCRPPSNRTPEADEIASCMTYLQRQIELIQPKLIIALGKVASDALLGKDATLASLRGKLHDYKGIPLIVTYHPAYLLRSPSEKAKVWQDLCLAVKQFENPVNSPE